MPSRPSEANTSSRVAVNFGVSVADEEPKAAEAVGKFPGQLGHPRPSGMRGDTAEMHSAGGVLDEDQHVQPPKERGVHGEEVASRDAFGLYGEEL
jgi:hypothetical protein